MVDVGRVVIKLTGREAGQKGVIVEILDNNFVTIDGNVKRRKCNIDHLALLTEKLDIKEGADSKEIKDIFKERGWLNEKEVAVKEKRKRKGGKKPKKKAHKKGKKKPKKSEEEQVEDALKSAEKK